MRTGACGPERRRRQRGRRRFSGMWSAPPQPYITLFQEVRVGAFAHNPNHDENAPLDLSVETLSSNLQFASFSNPYVNWFLSPRIALGAMVNTGGMTSYVFGSFNWRIPIYKMLFFEGEFGGAVNNSPDWRGPVRVDTGCPVTFRELGGFRPSTHFQLGRDRKRRAHFAREFLHEQEPRHHRFRRQSRLQVLSAGPSTASKIEGRAIDACQFALLGVLVHAMFGAPSLEARVSRHDRLTFASEAGSVRAPLLGLRERGGGRGVPDPPVTN